MKRGASVGKRFIFIGFLLLGLCSSSVCFATTETFYQEQLEISATVNINIEPALLETFTIEGIKNLITDLIEYQTFTIPEITNLLVGQEITASHAPERAARVNDRAFDTSWTARAEPPYWLSVDLGEPYLLARWILYLRSSYPPNYTTDSNLNAADFILLTSIDGQNWYISDAVEANKQGITNRALKLVEARYIKLLITTASGLNFNQDIVLYEWELYGISPNNI